MASTTSTTSTREGTPEYVAVPDGAHVTPKQLEVLGHWNAGMSRKEIAVAIGQAHNPNRAANYLREAFEACGRADLIGTRTAQGAKRSPIEQALDAAKAEVEKLEGASTPKPTEANMREALERRVKAAQDSLAAFNADPKPAVKEAVAQWTARSEATQAANTERIATLRKQIAALEGLDA